MSKKLFKRIISSLVLVVLTLSLSFPATAQFSKAVGSGLFVATPSVPDEVIAYAQADFGGHLMAMVESNDFGGDPYEVQLGTPFTYLGDKSAIRQYYFPVLYNGDIEYIYRVYEDVIYFEKTGELRYVGSMSSVLVDAFTGLMEKTSNDSPATLVVDNGDILAIVGSQVEVIAEDMLDDSSNPSARVNVSNRIMANDQDLSIINAVNVLDYKWKPISQRATSNYISMSITETQPAGNYWCTAYATAAILRTVKGGNLTAATIANYFNLSTTQGLSLGEAILYAQIHYQMYPIYLETALSNAEVKNEIHNGHPILANMRYSFTVSHAIAIRGYNSSTYSVWNPWYTT